jgi:trehalose 6-phosphate synthase/phosphatase
MNPLLRRRGGIWIGWSGDTGEDQAEERRAVLQDWARAQHCFAIDLPAEVATGFYEGYANQTLWPVFHYFPSQLKFDARGWEAYVEANRIFCRAVVDRYQSGDLIWVHDYHLLLLPQMLREALADATIGFFLHIPFPSPEVFPVLPRREELLQGLLGADLLAFQTHGHLQQFRSSLLRVLGIESRVAEIALGGRAIRLEALPIGIAPEEYTDLLAGDHTTAQHYSEWVARYRGRKVLLAVDRLDYTKGDRGLERHPWPHTGKEVQGSEIGGHPDLESDPEPGRRQRGGSGHDSHGGPEAGQQGQGCREAGQECQDCQERHEAPGQGCQGETRQG